MSPPLGGVECSDVTVPLGTVITAARPAFDLTTQSPKFSHPISGSSGCSTNFQLEGEWRLWDLKEYWQRKSPGIPAGANRKKKFNGSSPDTATSGGYHSPGDSATGIYGEGHASSATLEDLESQYQELAVALDSSSAIISQLSENINSLVHTLKEGKQHGIHWVQKLGRNFFKLKNQMAEPLASEPPARPSEVEQLQDETNHLKKELESVGRQLQAEVENNQMLSLLNRRQEERLQEQERLLDKGEELLE
ncbi:putative golgin subfamily A member 6-like protein 3 [Pan paniscus]|uniref:putative golgin subfamily A member 6-like protein 3 n=1 Tax=Pan paniscus TaxID=9597 RepID=UPI003006E2CA